MNDTVLWYATRGAGAVGMVMLTGVVVLGVLSALRFETAAWPRFVSPALHRNLALISISFLALHVLTAVVDPFTHLGWAVAAIPFSSTYRTFWLGLGTISADLVAALVVTSLVRRFLGQRSWRAVHWLAYLAWPLAVVHGLGTGTDAGSLWLREMTVACVAAVGAALGARLWLGPRDPLAAARALARAGARRPEVRR